MTEGELFKSKSQVEEAIPRYTNKMERQLKLKLKAFRSDNGGEYVSKQLQKWAAEKGIQWEFTVPYNPHQNGVAERANRTILEKTRTMLLAANLKKSLWPLAYLWAIQLKNQSPSFALPEVTPTQALHGRIPDLRHLRVFGCVAYVHIPQEKRVKSAKLEPRSRKCQMVGYDGSGIYRACDRSKIIRTKDVIFDETLTWIGQTANLPPSQPAIQQNSSLSVTTQTPQPIEELPLELELQGVNEALENDGGDGIDHSHIPPTPAESNISNSNSLDTESVPRESRIRQRPKLPTGFEYTAWLTTAFLSGYEAGVQDPSTYHEAMTGINAKEWKLGCDDKFHSLNVNNTWKLVPRPRDHTVLGGKWVFKAKRDSEGRITRYKTRWVVQGFRQQHGVDFDET